MAKTDVVKTNPTKEFFVYMLTADLDLLRAVNDLIDNAVDGARRMNAKNYKQRFIRLTVKPDRFEIHDNCGGISIDEARNRAFRFGRTGDAKETKHSIGIFGIGMKRSIFKLGEHFEVSSTTSNSTFTIKQSIPEWLKKDDADWDWHFEKGYQDGKTQEPEKIGTTIVITHLYPGVKEYFNTDKFQNTLRDDLTATHEYPLGKGLQLTLNSIPIEFDPSELLSDDEFQPESHSYETTIDGQSIKVKITAGLAAISSPKNAGWYVYCNGRLILRADKTSITGWGDRDRSLPIYHNQFALFRGYVFFESDNSKLLPWNTTKSALDVENPLYRAAKQQMVAISRIVFDYLNELKQQKEEEEAALKKLEEKAKKAKKVRTSAVKEKSSFKRPASEVKAQQNDLLEISYARPAAKIAALKRQLNTRSTKLLGERTFDIVYSLEVGDDDV